MNSLNKERRFTFLAEATQSWVDKGAARISVAMSSKSIGQLNTENRRWMALRVAPKSIIPYMSYFVNPLFFPYLC